MNKLIKRKLWIYVFPALMDFSVAAVLLFSSIRAVAFGASSVIVGILGSVWGITYSGSSFILSKVINRENAAGFMIFSCVGFIFIGLFFNLCTFLFPLFLLLFFGGLCSALFFIGFQIFMGDNTGLPHHKTSALYTLSWSGGMAFGSLAEGSLISAGIFYAQIPVLFSSIIIIPGIIAAKRMNRNSTGNIRKAEKKVQSELLVKKYIYVAWIEIFSVTLVTTGIRYLLPKMTISFFLFTETMAGIAVFVFFILQAITGYVMSFLKVFRYRILSHHFMKLAGIVSLIMPIIFQKTPVIFIFVGLLGIYAGHAFYSAVFYAVNDEEKSGVNVGINEFLVGIASVCGPFLLGLMLNISINYFLLVPCAMLVLTGFVQHRFLKHHGF